MEAGHIAQNLQLVATARRLRVCGVTGFVDDTVNDVLGLPAQGETQALYLLAVGRPPTPTGSGA
ncbi:putative SagB-type dehydrogenase domain-containing protein [Streptomyces viridochromogenes Tue57]|uniref:Putative SagB-type dehydrogenase domain-containing protein n=2 Tax=Streptomyces viridochromogenes TaxID=1938 RepID=L8PMT9_STRVR|nr:putative SagB-type dehydrogenase domain-containing protein [Streptomyces viridochromogenes Tue57]